MRPPRMSNDGIDHKKGNAELMSTKVE
jgi:hypothetical protein